VRELVQPATAVGVPMLTPAVLDLGIYDQLLAAGGNHA